MTPQNKTKNQVHCKPACAVVQSSISICIQFSNQLSCKGIQLHQEAVHLMENQKLKCTVQSMMDHQLVA